MQIAGIKVRVRIPERTNTMSFNQKERLRGFISQYVIARAPSFTKERETEEAWECTLRARTIFHALDKVADAEPEDDHNPTQGQINAIVGRQTTVLPPHGATGPSAVHRDWMALAQAREQAQRELSKVAPVPVEEAKLDSILTRLYRATRGGQK